MLVLSRVLGEEVVVLVPRPDGGFESVVVAVVGLDRGKVRLGFSARPEVLIYRSELLDEKGDPPCRPTSP